MSDWAVVIETGAAERDAIIADLWELGTTGIAEEDESVRAFFDGTSDREAVLARLAVWSPKVQEVEPHDWVQHAQSMWSPICVGERFWLVPEWSEDAAPNGRMRLPMRSGTASGSGLHAATRLCLMAMERVVRPGMRVLDVGTGSGILAEAARLLGARTAVACDIDHDATRFAKEHVAGVLFYTGSLRSVRGAATDIIVANLNVPTLATVAGDLARVGDTASAIVISGFREDEIPKAARSLPRSPKETLELEGWACLVC